MKNQVKKFIKEHKKELAIAGVVVGGVIVWNLPAVKKKTINLEAHAINRLIKMWMDRHNKSYCVIRLVDACRFDKLTGVEGSGKELYNVLGNATQECIDSVIKKYGMSIVNKQVEF